MNSIIRRGVAVGLTVAACALIAGCDNSYLDQGSGRSQQPISSATLAEMDKLDTTPSSPTIIRTYKKEAELEIWKMKSNGEYALLKTYPMCRWSGQLGPKKREGDMQVPEGFYTIAPGQMNPNVPLLFVVQRRISERLRSGLRAHRRQCHGARRLFVRRLFLDDRRAGRRHLRDRP